VSQGLKVGNIDTYWLYFEFNSFSLTIVYIF